MGNGGGDPKSACENTFEATEAGLKAGMNAVRVDVSMSAEGILFLWRDHLPGTSTYTLFYDSSVQS
jgi:glycerophosphoryl diester phosphodiesterase